MWMLDGALNFAGYAGLPLLLVVGTALLLRSRRLVLVACVPLVIWGAFLGAGRLVVAPGLVSAACAASPLRVVTANVMYSNERLAELADEVLAQQPDVIVFEELRHDLATFSPTLAEAYPYRISTETPWVTLASRLPLGDARRLPLPGGDPGREPLVANVVVAGERITVVATHETPPLNRGTFIDQQAQRALIAAEVRRAEGPVVALGDFNATLSSPAFLRFLWTNSLQVASDGLIHAATHVPIERLGLRIDHVLLRGLDVCGTDVFELPGSDHRAVVADLLPRNLPTAVVAER